jgi:EAL domain-containing protein (putative c-di-GMP-specific phosphodiesterase class I)
MENAEIASSMLLQLRALGVQLSIDDFGTGYSSLSYLHRFPVNTLKIDRSFISRLGAGDENTEIVRTIMTLANNLGMDVVAEGVETEEHLKHLKQIRCQYAQGYLFSKAVDAETASALLQGEREQSALTSYTTSEQEELNLLNSPLVM